MRELELKLSVEDPFVTPALRPDGVDVAGMEELPALDLRATYYDTTDLRLARNGVSLRYRTGEGELSGWSLKLPVTGEDASSRDELHFGGSAGRVPPAARDLVIPFARAAELGPVARLHTRRRRWCLRGADGKELAELVDDRVSVMKEGRVVERFRELEIESRAANRPVLDRIALALQKAGASPPRPLPKIVRALGARASLPPDVLPPARVSPRAPAAYAIQAALARGVQRALANDPGSRLGEVEPVHQMRVGARRLRSDLRTFAPMVDSEWADRLRSELRWLATALGRVRDLDVMQERLRAGAHGLRDLEPLFGHLDEMHLVARAGLLKALRSDRYVELLDHLVEAVQSPVLTADAWRPCAEALPPLAARTWKRLAREARSLGPDEPDERLHAVRILAKQSRYAAEAVAPALGARRSKKASKFARRAAAVQDTLGVLQDSALARALISEVSSARPADGPFNLAAGRLIERQELAAREARADFRHVWSRLDRPKLRDWM